MSTIPTDPTIIVDFFKIKSHYVKTVSSTFYYQIGVSVKKTL